MQLYKRVATPTLIIGLLLIILVGVSPVHADPGDETTYYLLTDHLGSIDVVLDDQGEVVERRDFVPYGEERINETTPDSPETDHKFTGKELDDETGLYYYGARYYDPLIGRFSAIDPWSGDLARPQTLNKYSYVHNNPITFVDPTGMVELETGKVEDGDTMSTITAEYNDYFGTDLSYQDLATINDISDPDNIQIGDIIMMGLINDDGSVWQRSYDASDVTIGYWGGLTEGQQMVTHFGRNLFQPGNQLPWSESAANAAGWENMGVAIAHNLAGAEGNVDYRGTGVHEGQQAIYDSNGLPVATPENGGTYDFNSPSGISGSKNHYTTDVRPWVQWGNSPQDTTTSSQRESAFKAGIANKITSIFK